MRKLMTYIAVCTLGLFIIRNVRADEKHDPAHIKAVYLSTNNIYNKKKIAELEDIIKTTPANGIVIDFKDSNALPQAYLAQLRERFANAGAYTIARIVTFQDSFYARKHPEIAVKTSAGALWQSGLKKWRRYWLDPASPLAQHYNIEIAKRAADAGFDEIQFDYIRFPTDGNMKDIRYPVFDPATQTKSKVMRAFFARIRRELKSYAPHVLIGIDLFGEVFLYGGERGIGQELADAAQYFDVLSPMAYPSHYKCKAFGALKPQDPNWHPYLVASTTLKKGFARLHANNIRVIVRPWIQAFTWPNIYGCSPNNTPRYGPERINAQIEAGKELGINGFMPWNVANVFPLEIFY